MQAYYAKFVDRFIPPQGEKLFRLGRRLGRERRLMDDRRAHIDEDLIESPDERRNTGESRRVKDERRVLWVRMSRWRSRHV
jgi:hypothetical protein